MTDTSKPARRIRHDGWTEERAARFLAARAEGATVGAAAAQAGLSRAAAYKARGRNGSAIAAAWPVAAPIDPATIEDLLADAIDTGGDAASSAIEAADPRELRRMLRLVIRRNARRASRHAAKLRENR